MPQPLSRVVPEAKVGIWFAPANLAAAPDTLCKLVWRVVANWSSIESSVLHLSAARLKADYERVAAMLLAPRSSDAQMAAAQAGIKHGMSAEELAYYEAFWSLAEPCRKVRHRLAHHLWGYTAELPGYLLLLDPHYNVRLSAQLFSHFRREERFVLGESDEEPGSEPEIDNSQIFLYSHDDLLREVRACQDVVEIAQHLIPCLGGYPEDPDERTKMLKKHPRLEEAHKRCLERGRA